MSVLHLWLRTEYHLKAAALRLGARRVPGWSEAEKSLARNIDLMEPEAAEYLAKEIRRGEDPLGTMFCHLRSATVRRSQGATYTPPPVASAMAVWARDQKLKPSRVVDPGAGSARFLLAAAKHFPDAELVGIEIDPLAALLARANLAVAGLEDRARILLGDYRNIELPTIDGRTLFIGNPPYVRHHQLTPEWKTWLTKEAKKLGFGASQLAGLHVYFFLATVLKARKGDFGTFITSAEWMDVNYGRLVRELFLHHLGGSGITIVEPTSRTFEDAATTAAITQFVIGSRPASVRVKRVPYVVQPSALSSGRMIHRNRLEVAQRWSHLTRKGKDIPQDYVELGELCRVHRGAVTGANRIWIAGEHSRELPTSVLFPSVTRAKELFAAGSILEDSSHLRDVIDIPQDLSALVDVERKAVERFLRRAKSAGADAGYVAQNRKAWWSVGLRTPAPILATYMARRPPAFVRNIAEVRHINIAHGLYPRDPLSITLLDRLARFLNGAVSTQQGRTYAGGLTKFEPREMERIPVPSPAMLENMA